MSQILRFECDYTEGAHPRIMDALVATNMEQTCGYSEDAHCERARELIKKACGSPEADVHFLVGGTQTNLTVIASILRPHQGVLCADSGHINCHETGAVEATGHKVLPLPSVLGRICAEQIAKACEEHSRDSAFEHIVQPGMVYISYPTECGTLYSKTELEAISAVCKTYGLPLFIDGARMGYGLAAYPELSLEEISRLCDVFYIGGTKVGALFGEAVVILNPALKRDFRYLIKQKGGMLAKGRLLGIQFETLFEDGLYYRISEHAVAMAMRIKTALEEKGIDFIFPSDTNQQFPIFSKEQMRKLSESYSFCYWQPVDEERDAWRICTSWATKEENVEALIADIRAL